MSQPSTIVSPVIDANIRRREVDAMNAVCRVLQKNGEYGTGFVIHRQLIMTNNHVLPNKEACLGQRVQFYYEKDTDSIEVELDPEACFITSETPGSAPITEKYLDFTIVALKTHPDPRIQEIYNKAISLFQHVIPKIGESAYIIQHPQAISGVKRQEPYKALHESKVIAREEFSVHYDTLTAGGSSGSPVLNSERQLYALHRMGGCLSHNNCNQGVQISAIVHYLETHKDPAGPPYSEIIKNWSPLAAKLTLQFLKIARNKAQIAINSLRSSDQQGTWTRRQLSTRFSEALQSYENIKKRKLTPEEKALVDKEFLELKGHLLRVELNLSLSTYLPEGEGTKSSSIEFLQNADDAEALELIKELVEEEQQKYSVDSKESKSPSFCFFLAFSYHFLGQIKESACWYLRLAQSYNAQFGALYLIRRCLNKAKDLDVDLAQDPTFLDFQKSLVSKEKALDKAFEQCLQKIKAKNSSEPRCYVLHHKSVEEWVSNNLYKHLRMIGARPSSDSKDQPLHLPEHRFKAHVTFNADFAIAVLTPDLVLEDKNLHSPTAFSMDLLMKRFPGASSSQIIPFFLEGDWAETAPLYFTRAGGFDATYQENYYLNALKAFCLIKKIDLEEKNSEAKNFAEELQDDFNDLKSQIEKGQLNQLEFAKLQAPSAPLPQIVASPFAHTPSKKIGTIPEFQSLVARGVWNGDFHTSNVIIINQEGGVLFKTGKTALAAKYALSSSEKYPYIIWVDGNDLENSVKHCMQELKIESSFKEWLEDQPRWLLVFDSIKDESSVLNYIPEIILHAPQELPPETLRHIIITTRSDSWNIGLSISMGPFTGEEGIALVKEISKRAPLSPELSRQIVNDCDGIPEKVHEMALWVSKHPSPKMWEHWKEVELKPKEFALRKKSNLPVTSSNFFFRPESLTVLEKFLRNYPSATIYGNPGVGKTQLAFNYSLLHVTEYEKLGWIDGSNEDSFSKSCELLLKKWEIPSLDNPLNAFNDFVQNHPCLLIVRSGPFWELRSQPLNLHPQGRLLQIATHSQPADLSLHLESFRPSEALRFLRDCYGILDPDAKHLADFFQNHPLTLSLAASYIQQKKQSVETYLLLLSSEKIKSTSSAEDKAFTAFYLIKKDLSESDKDILEACALFELPIVPREALNRYLMSKGLDALKIDDCLLTLAKYGLIQFGESLVVVPSQMKEWMQKGNYSFEKKQRKLKEILSQ